MLWLEMALFWRMHRHGSCRYSVDSSHVQVSTDFQSQRRIPTFTILDRFQGRWQHLKYLKATVLLKVHRHPHGQTQKQEFCRTQLTFRCLDWRNSSQGSVRLDQHSKPLDQEDHSQRQKCRQLWARLLRFVCQIDPENWHSGQKSYLLDLYQSS